MSTKKKISDVAEEYGISKDKVLELLREGGFEVRTTVTPLEAAWVEAIRPNLEASKGTVKKKAAPKKPVAPKKPAAKKEEGDAAPAPEAASEPVAEKPAPAPVVEKAPEPVAEKPAPAPVVEKAPEPVAEKPAPAPVAEKAPEAPAPAAGGFGFGLTAPVRRQPSFTIRPNEPKKPAAATYTPTPRGISGGPRAGFTPGGEKTPGGVPPVPGQEVQSAQRPARDGARPGAPGAQGGQQQGGPGRDGRGPRPAASSAGPFRPAPGGQPGAPGAPGAPGVQGGPPRPGQPGAPTGQQPGPHRRTGPGGKRKTKEQIESEILQQVQQNVNKVMVSLDRGKSQRRYGRHRDMGQDVVEEKKVLKVSEFVTISELANLLDVPASQVIGKAMGLGMMVTINARLEHETIAIIADEFGYAVELMDEYAELLAENQDNDAQVDAEPIRRPPIVTVMGHVDHGKTSLLDYYRKTSVIAGEAGGITQHIGAYEVQFEHGAVTFLDTPGHEAFSAMRARGAKVTDIVILVVAADSMVMPQTKEAIDHARAANSPIVVAVNKCDLPSANPDKIRAQLAEYGLSVEGWGGGVQCVEISAKKGLNMDKLLDAVLLEAEVLNLMATPEKNAKGTVVEARLDKGKGVISTILIQDGTLRVGDTVLCGNYAGRVKQLLNERGRPTESAGPSVPVQVMGLDGVPQAGDTLLVFEDERECREIAARRQRASKERELRRAQRFSLEDLSNRRASGEEEQLLRVIVKGDMDGSVEAISAQLEQLTCKEVRVEIVSRAVGGIKEADVMLAAASNAIIVGFHVRPDVTTREIASREGVEIRTYRVIYEVIDDIRKAMEGLLKPEIREEIAAEAEVRAIFSVPKLGQIAGCMVVMGTIDRHYRARVYRNGIEMGESKIATLKRFKDDVHEVRQGFECGIGLGDFNEFKEGDTIAFFRQFEVARKLSEPLSKSH